MAVGRRKGFYDFINDKKQLEKRTNVRHCLKVISKFCQERQMIYNKGDWIFMKKSRRNIGLILTTSVTAVSIVR